MDVTPVSASNSVEIKRRAGKNAGEETDGGEERAHKL